jgi:phytoene dehydrogenase-like protein
MQRYIVVGGGLAGLTAANALAGEGRKVVLLEESAQLGGRARTKQDQGYLLNLGPHALHQGGVTAKTLRQWGVPIHGNPPDTSSDSFLVCDRRKYPLFYKAGGLLTTRLFTIGEKLQAARILKQLATGDAAERESMHDWIEQRASAQKVRQFVAMLMRIATYSADLSPLSARAALDHFRSATSPGVLYLDGGWQTLIAGLEQRARRLGVEIRLGERVQSLNAIQADGVVLAVPPVAVERITGRNLPTMNPVRVACLDLGLRALPPHAARIALAVDRPLYLSVHSVVARLAPAESALVHLCKYLDKSTDPASDRRELEEFADFAIPGWREQVEVTRFLPHMTVTAAAFSVQGRPAVDELDIPGVTMAGDWVGSEAMLADAAVASALRAASMVQRQTLCAA